MLAKDIMTVNVVSVSEEAPVHEIVKLLLKHRISAVPVLDAGGQDRRYCQRRRPAAA